MWGLTFGFVSVVLTALIGFSILGQESQNALKTSRSNSDNSEIKTDLDSQIIDTQANEASEPEQTPPAQTSRPNQTTQNVAPKEAPEETAYKQLFINTYNAVADAANSAQSSSATPESVEANKQTVISQRNSFSAASVPSNRSSSRNGLIQAMDTLINNYFDNRGSSIICSNGSSSTTQILYQACMTRRTNANSAFNLYISQAQQANNYFQQGQ